jgi:PAS domain-containing protein
MREEQLLASNILQSIHGFIYWEDIDVVYSGCNQAEAEMPGYKSAKEVVVSKTDYDLSWRYEAEILRKIDQRIMLNKALDDDVLVHDMWKSRFSEHSNEVSVKYFTQGLEVVDFITSLKEKNKVFLLSDYELENQELNGIDVIEKSNMQEQHILVMGVQTSEIKDFGEKSKFLKMFNKACFNGILLIIL